MLHLRSSRSALLPLGAFAIATMLSACGHDNRPSAETGSADVSVASAQRCPASARSLSPSPDPLCSRPSP